MKTIEQRIAQAKIEILCDVRDEIVPREVANFSELHDYVDANYYGGFIDDEVPVGEKTMDELIAVQATINKWIESGEMKRFL